MFLLKFSLLIKYIFDYFDINMLGKIALLLFCMAGVTYLEFSGWGTKFNKIKNIRKHPVFESVFKQENGKLIILGDYYVSSTKKTKDGIIIYQDDGTSQKTSKGVNISPFHVSGNILDEPAENFAGEENTNDQIDKLRAQLQDLYQSLSPLEQQLDEGIRDTL